MDKGLWLRGMVLDVEERFTKKEPVKRILVLYVHTGGRAVHQVDAFDDDETGDNPLAEYSMGDVFELAVVPRVFNESVTFNLANG